MEHIGKAVYVKELDENGKIVSANENFMGMMVYKVKTENFDGWACYLHEMDFI